MKPVVRIDVIEYDVLDQVIEERVEDETGQIYQKAQYEYDEFDYRIRTITWIGPPI